MYDIPFLIVRSALIDQTAVGCGFRWEESSCLRYLADLDHYLSNSCQQHDSSSGVSSRVHVCDYRTKDTPLLISYDLWIQFLSAGPKKPHSSFPLKRADATALWILFSSAAIAEEFAIRDLPESDELSNNGLSRPNQDVAGDPQDPYKMQLDFRHFSLLLFLQTRRSTTASRSQTYQRLQRAANEAGYQSPKTLPHRGNPSITGPSVSRTSNGPNLGGSLATPRSIRSPRSIPSPYGSSSFSSLLPMSTSAFSPRSASAPLIMSSNISSGALVSTTRAGSHPASNWATAKGKSGTSAFVEELKDFLASKLNILLRIVHRHYLSDVTHVTPCNLNALSILMQPVSLDKCNTTGVTFPSVISESITDVLTACATYESSSADAWSPTLVQQYLLNGLRSCPPEQQLPSWRSAQKSESVCASDIRRQGVTESSAPSFSSSSDNQSLDAPWLFEIDGRRRETLLFFDNDQDESSASNKDSRLHDHRDTRLPPSSPTLKHSVSTLLQESSTYPTVLFADLTECQIYFLKRARHVKIKGCTDTRIVLPGVSGIVTVTGCSNMEIMAAAGSFKIENSYEIKLHIYTLTKPILTGDTRGIVIGPYNAIFSQQKAFMRDLKLEWSDRFVAQWAYPIVLSKTTSSTNVGVSSRGSSSGSVLNTFVGTGRGPASSSLPLTSSARTASTASVDSVAETATQDACTPQLSPLLSTVESGLTCGANWITAPPYNSKSSGLPDNTTGTRHSVSPNASTLLGVGMHTTLNGFADSTYIATPSTQADDLAAAPFALVPPNNFRLFIVPEPSCDITPHGGHGNKKAPQDLNSCLFLPEVYAKAFALQQEQIHTLLAELANITAVLDSSPDDKSKIAVVPQTIHRHFVHWLHRCGALHELLDLAKIEMSILHAQNQPPLSAKRLQDTRGVPQRSLVTFLCSSSNNSAQHYIRETTSGST